MSEHKASEAEKNQNVDGIESAAPGSAGNDTACEKAEREEEDLQTRYVRLAADFQNFRRRAEKERGDIYAFANEKIIVELLDVIDNFERAMDHDWLPEQARLMEGMDLILQQLLAVLAKNHVEVIEALGQPFDPAVHDALMTEPSSVYGSGIVTRLVKKGYTLNKKVIRPAMVIVSADCTERTQ